MLGAINGNSKFPPAPQPEPQQLEKTPLISVCDASQVAYNLRERVAIIRARLVGGTLGTENHGEPVPDGELNEVGHYGDRIQRILFDVHEHLKAIEARLT